MHVALRKALLTFLVAAFIGQSALVYLDDTADQTPPLRGEAMQEPSERPIDASINSANSEVRNRGDRLQKRIFKALPLPDTGCDQFARPAIQRS